MQYSYSVRPAFVRGKGLSWLFGMFMLLALAPASALAAGPQEPDPELRAVLKRTVNEAKSFIDRFDAEVWLVDMSARMEKYVKDTNQRLELLKLVHLEASRAGLNPEIVLAVMHVESRFDPYAVSSAGARGLMQVMPFWINEIGRPEDNLHDVATNLRYGCTILKHYLDKEKGNLIRALARYNGSLGKTWYPERVLVAWERYWFVKHS
ncbi:Soluble lytic murein transglycosylase and related regulatory protein (some contain LysM/invasin domains) [Hahella chejuensis KCTC 2396]|uniref:Soluble lytic murein transglycosylase and related regulatory protein (Some contain LysM/invasin domains) n=1 Tax=Hahella chejuensis (strain KCTC 2396) TaxID=349521 RepID=Q2SD06_HAHCH|nr:Soluble lytic murein transglycosylase and related regulatory protein (some contain LysM/invasin domains) [Hahella chejuensis KCTC 2396]